ncbi:hypothetical protein CRUP_023390 [Coryphaenoides rupestris]|nr:hypothetical protein CRUP_023390 [Coryphaenoides rupestris]
MKRGYCQSGWSLGRLHLRPRGEPVRLLEALQLSHPAELQLRKARGAGPGAGLVGGRRPERAQPEPHLQTGAPACWSDAAATSRTMLRESFDAGTDVHLDQEHSVHDVAALLKEFLRDIPDPLLPRELYPRCSEVRISCSTSSTSSSCSPCATVTRCCASSLFSMSVQGHAQDSLGPQEEEVGRAHIPGGVGVGGAGPGAGADLGIEDSNAIINVTLVLIQTYKRLFTERGVQLAGQQGVRDVAQELLEERGDVVDAVLLVQVHVSPHLSDSLLRATYSEDPHSLKT